MIGCQAYSDGQAFSFLLPKLQTATATQALARFHPKRRRGRTSQLGRDKLTAFFNGRGRGRASAEKAPAVGSEVENIE